MSLLWKDQHMTEAKIALLEVQYPEKKLYEFQN